MAQAQTPPRNLLQESGKPVFFRAAESAPAGLRAGAEGSVRVVARTLDGMQKEALVASGKTGVLWRLASDEGAYLAGLDAAPCPLAFFTVGLVASLHGGVLALAHQRRLPAPDLRLVLDSYYTMRGSALDGTMVGGARDARLVVQTGTGTDEALIRPLAQEAVLASPIARLLHRALPSRFALQHNGHILPVDPLPACTDAGTPGEDLLFDQANPQGNEWSNLLERGMLTPRAEHSVTAAGGSLAAQQDRVLHVRGVSILRPDGLLEVQQYLYNPHGTMFRFVCDPAPLAGTGPRAPGPFVYASAGIAFCFMTQFGRYASIRKLPLEDCRIVQDTHFAPGSAPLPVDTAVRLRSGASDADARQMLAMAEQTCFLHALCKAVQKIRMTVQTQSQGLPPATL